MICHAFCSANKIIVNYSDERDEVNLCEKVYRLSNKLRGEKREEIEEIADNYFHLPFDPFDCHSNTEQTPRVQRVWPVFAQSDTTFEPVAAMLKAVWRRRQL